MSICDDIDDEPWGRVVAARAPDPARGRAGVVEVWLEDLWWHRKMYGGARWRWTAQDVLDLVTGCTKGRLDFTSMRDLAILAGALAAAAEQSAACELAFGEHVREAKQVMSFVDRVAEALVAVSPVECAVAEYLAVVDRDSPRSSPQIAAVRGVVARQAYTSPLILALEVGQLWRAYQAAEAMLEDALCDLVVDLRLTRPDAAICSAVGATGGRALDTRIAFARETRGLPGDPRRVPRQVLFPPAGDPPSATRLATLSASR